MKKSAKRILYYAIPLILALILIVLLILPYGIKKYINDHGIEYTGRKTSVRDIKLNYFTSTLSVLDFKLYEADGKAMFVSFDTLLVHISPFPLLNSKLVVEKFRLVHPAVTIIRKDSVFNFDDIIAFMDGKPKPKAETPDKPSSPFKYILKDISMEYGTLVFEDKTVENTTRLNNLGFLIPALSFNQDEIKEIGIKFNFENGGFFQAKTDFNQKSGSYSADFSIDKLRLSPFLPYAKGYFHLSSLSGLLGGDFHVSGNINHIDSILLLGEGHVTDFAANELSGQKVLGAKSAGVTILDSYPMKNDFKIGLIQIIEPYLFVEMKDSTINLLHLMVESPGDTVSSDYNYQISKLSIEQGVLDLRDNSYEAPFDYHLSEIEMNVDSVSSAANWLNASTTMKLNKRGNLQAKLGINPSDPYEIKLNYVITNFLLSDLNIYSLHFVGFPILLGNMYYKGNTVISNKQLNSENKLIIRDARLGKKSGGLLDIPLKLALYLLKDIHGDIILNLPLTGDLNDPKTKIGRLVWQMLKNVVVKVVASPFIALSGLLGVEPAEVKGIEFNYADTTLTDVHLRRIKLFTDLEQKKPDLKIEVTGFNDSGLEKKEIALQEAGKLFFEATGTDAKKDNASFVAFLSEKVHRDTLSAVTGSRLLIGESKLDSIQQSISLYRVSRIERALRSFSDSTKIKVTVPNKELPENVGSRPVFELKFSVEE